MEKFEIKFKSGVTIYQGDVFDLIDGSLLAKNCTTYFSKEKNELRVKWNYGDISLKTLVDPKIRLHNDTD